MQHHRINILTEMLQTHQQQHDINHVVSILEVQRIQSTHMQLKAK